MAQPVSFSAWRNVGRRLGILQVPSAGDEEPLQHLEPGAVFLAARVAVVAGRRYLQRADGSGWIPECSRKDASRVVVEAVDSSASAPGDSSAANATDDAVVACPAPFPKTHVRVRFLRVFVRETRSETSPGVQIGQISLRCRGRLLDMSGFLAENPCGNSPKYEGPEKVFAPKGKWLDLCFREHEQSVLLITAPTEIEVDDFAFRTASDAAHRDPVHLTIHGSLDGWEWIKLHEMAGDLYTPKARLAWSPWLQLRPDPAESCSLDAAEQVACRLQALPSEVSWWRNVGKRLGILSRPCSGVEPSDHLQPNACFAALRVTSVDGLRYFQLAGGRGFVPERSRKDTSRVVAVPAEGPLDVPAAAVAAAAAAVGAPTALVRVQSLRLTVLATRSSAVLCTQISQLCLRCQGSVLSFDGFVAANPLGQSPSGEGVEKLLVGGGKWLDINFSTNQKSVILLTAPHEVSVDDIAFCTANDGAARDPVSLRVEGSCDGKDWVLLHETGECFPTPLGRRCWSPWLSLCAQERAPVGPPLPPSAVASAEFLKMDARRGRHAFARRSFLKRKRSFSDKAATASAAAAASDSAAAPVTPVTPKRPSRRQCSGAGSRCSALPLSMPSPPLSTPSRPELPVHGAAARLEAEGGGGSKPRPAKRKRREPTGKRKHFRLAALSNALVGQAVDVEAVVTRVGEVLRKPSMKNPQVLVNMRRFEMRDGDTSCFWVLLGRRAERFGAQLLGRRVVARGATVHAFKSALHLSGCVRVDVRARAAYD